MTRSFLALAAAAALAAPAAPAHADPTLPPGWVAGGRAAVMATERAPSRRSLEGRRLAASPRRPALSPVPLSLEAFDLVEVEPELSVEEVAASNAEPSGEPAADVFVDRGCGSASVLGHAVGRMEVGGLSEAIGPNASGGPDLVQVRGTPPGGAHRFALAYWETLDRQPDGTVRYMQASGRFNLLTCKTTLASRFTVTARPILGGAAYLFRTRCARCAPAKGAQLHVLMPHSDWRAGEYEHSTLALGVDGADSVRVRLERFRVERFARAFGGSPLVPRTDENLLVGIEVAQGLGEAGPSVIAYAAGVRHGS